MSDSSSSSASTATQTPPSETPSTAPPSSGDTSTQTPPPTQAPKEPPKAQTPPTQAPTTGPFEAVGKWFSGVFGGAARASTHTSQARPASTTQTPPSAPQTEHTPLARMRAKIEEFDEDYRGMGDRLLGFFMQFVGYIGPYVIVVGVGSDLGTFFAPVWGPFSSLLIAYVLESVIASCTVAMGRAFEEISNAKAGWGKVGLTVAIWLVLNASSAFGLYWQASEGGLLHNPHENVMLIMRVCAIALADLGCSCVLMWRGKSIQKHIESIRKRATAIGELADAERSIQEADKNAALREQMMQSTLKIQEDLSVKIGEAVSMVMESILQKMEHALKDEGKSRNEGRYGSH